MGGVDVSDKSIYHNSCDRNTTKYWKKLFFNYLDIAMFNAYVLYSKNTDKPLARRDFLISVLENLAKEHDDPVAGPAGDGDHRIDKLPGRQLRICVVCKTGRSRFLCPGCNSGVHRECFHKLEHFWRPKKGGKKRARESDSSSE